mgnify:CR=1 FL=1
MNWTVGCVGAMNEGGWTTAEPFGWWESHGTPVEPRSLYLAQLRDRLGEAAVEDVRPEAAALVDRAQEEKVLTLTLAVAVAVAVARTLTLTPTRWAARRGGSPTRPASRTGAS